MDTVVRFRLVFLLSVILAASVLAADEDVVPLGPGVTPPRVTRQVNPVHPPKGFRISGTVLLSVVVGTEGVARDPRVLRSLEKDIDQSAIDAVLKWQFSPAMKEGKPVATRVSIEIRFHDM